MVIKSAEEQQIIRYARITLKITQEVSKKPISKFIKNSSDINMKMIEEAVDLKTLYAGFKTKVFVWIIFLTFMIISFNRNIFCNDNGLLAHVT